MLEDDHGISVNSVPEHTASKAEEQPSKTDSTMIKSADKRLFENSEALLTNSGDLQDLTSLTWQEFTAAINT